MYVRMYVCMYVASVKNRLNRQGAQKLRAWGGGGDGRMFARVAGSLAAAPTRAGRRPARVGSAVGRAS